jgi:hypothetical protein
MNLENTLKTFLDKYWYIVKTSHTKGLYYWKSNEALTVNAKRVEQNMKIRKDKDPQ